MTTKRERPDPAPVGTSTATLNLAAWYDENGESEFLARLEAALLDTWQTTKQMSAASGCSINFCLKGLDYLALRGRAERKWEWWQPKPFRRSVMRYSWRLPVADEGNGS